MSTRIAAFVRNNVTGLIAIFIALGGVAYANNEWTGDNIVNGSLTSLDYKNNNIKGVDLAPNAIPSDEGCSFPTICFGSTRIADRAVGASEISPGAVGTSEAAPNSFTGSDINEATLDPSALPGPAAYEYFDDDTGQLCNGYCTEGTLRSIPAGTYLILGKIDPWAQTYSDSDIYWVECRLVAGSDSASADFDGSQVEGFVDQSTLNMQVIHTFDSPDNISINCRDHDQGSLYARYLKIAAIRLGSVN
jgi:hypothetical protein